MPTRKLFLLLALACLVLLPVTQAFAQAVANAQIHGIVQDPSGAAVADAKIRAIQVDTGRVQTAVSGADGSYILPGLPVGAYSVEVTSSSFNRFVQTGIVLQVGQNVQVNVTLTVGTVTQEVRVAADASMVETQDTSVSEVIDQKRIIDIPLNGRQITDLVLLSGGSAAPPNGPSKVVTSHDYTNSAAISVNGGQINGNNYLLDGADHNDSHSNINMPFPFPDALQEFSVQTSGVSSRYGLHPGAVVNVVTKSGTNSYHGSLFEFLRNGDFNATTFPSTTQDPLKRNQYGGTFGGPLLKNKLFFFGGIQETAIRTAPSTTTAFVATQAELNGDFSTEQSAACQSTGAKVLIDPSTGQPFANTNHIDPTRYTAPSLALLKLMPVSSDPCGKLVFAIPNPSNEYQVVGRMDWNQSSRNTVTGRYFILDYSNPPAYTNNILTTAHAGVLDRAQSIVLGDQFSVTPNIVNSFHAGFTRLAIHRNNPSNMPNMGALGSTVNTAVPNFIDLAVTGFFTVGGSSNAPANYIRNQWQLSDDIDWIHGRNHFSLGGEYIAGQMDATNLTYANGEFNFQAASQTTAQKNAGQQENALADYLLGTVNTFRDSNLVVNGLRQKYIGLYFEDNIQLTKTLNIHAGIRWEPFLPEYDAGLRGNAFSQANFNANKVTSLYTNAPPGLLFSGDPGIPKGYANASWADFAPRFGFAWDPTGSGKQTIRGSYGVFFDQPESYTNSVMSLDAPWGNTVTLTRPGGGLVNPFAVYPGGNPFPIPTPPSKSSVFPTAATYYFIPLDAHHPYMQQWGLSLERQFGNDWVVTADYLGNKTTHLRAGRELNSAVYIPGTWTGSGTCGTLTVSPGTGKACSSTGNTQDRRTLSQINPATGPYYSTLSFLDDGDNSNYNALRVSARHRFSHSFSILSVYTWSHCLQDAEPIGNKIATTESNPNSLIADFGPCDFDLRHNWVNSVIYEGYRFNSRALDLIAGRWQTGFVLSLYNGFPVNVTAGADNSLSGVGLDRPDAISGVSSYVRNNSTHQWINPAAYKANSAGTFGTTSYNSLIGPHFVNVDANLTKAFHVYKEHDLQLRFEFFNLFNHTNYGLPVSTFNSATFGQIQTTANSGRIIQLAAKYSF